MMCVFQKRLAMLKLGRAVCASAKPLIGGYCIAQTPPHGLRACTGWLLQSPPRVIAQNDGVFAQIERVIPFGKYKGQPVEHLLADPDYRGWILAQPGLMTMLEKRHPALINVITVGAPTTNDTPEHNKIQALFLGRDFQYAFLELMTGKSVLVLAQEQARKRLLREMSELPKVKETVSRLEGYIKDYESRVSYGEKWCVDNLARAREELAEAKKKLLISPAYPLPPKVHLDFECGYDVDLKCGWGSYYVRHYRIEIKPQMGDDYPSVLRQMKRNGASTLLIGFFEAESVTLKQVRGVFGDNRVVLLDEIQAIINRGVWQPGQVPVLVEAPAPE